MVYRLILSYCGAPFAGWQRQANAVAVQEVVERALERLLNRTVSLVGASRTDAGVHARGQVAHLELDRLFSGAGLIFGTNHRLPSQVRVLAANRMPTGFHARKDAVAKEYRYRLSRQRVLSPLDEPYAVRANPALDLKRIRAATRHLVGRHDFTAFAKVGGSHRQPFRSIHTAEWQEWGPELRFRIVGDGFLRGMVRGLVGTLIEVGQGRLAPDEFAALLEGQPRHASGPTAPARGLTLHRVFYPATAMALEE